MNIIEEAIATLGIPGSIAVVIVMIFAVLQVIGEFIEAFGKVSPSFLKIRKIWIRRNKKKVAQEKFVQQVKTMLDDMSSHYSEENIKKRNDWMDWVNDRAKVYDATLADYQDTIAKLTDALDNNTKMTERMFAETSRDRIFAFADKLVNTNHHVSREEFRRIFKVYNNYEAFLKERDMKNGEVDINYQIILDQYKKRQHSGEFLEDIE